MQKITLIGRLGRDAAVRETSNGTKVISLAVAANSFVKGVEKTSWYDVSTFNYDRYANMVKYLTKGSSVIVTGDLDADIEKGNDGVTRCRRVVMADSISFNQSGNSGSTQTSEAKESAPMTSNPESDDDEPKVIAAKSTKKAKAEDKEAVQTTQTNDDDLPF